MRAERAGSTTPEVSVGGRTLPLAEFLAGCLDPSGDQELVAARLTFLAGGLDALRTAGAPRWTQLGLGGIAGELYRELALSARELLAEGEITDFFFMHKPPGLRVRFAAAPGRATHVRAELRRRAQRWRSTGLVTDVQPGVYEPEAHLFGGPASMRHVHRLFTVDSLAWLDHHSGGHGQAPSWVVSLLMLRSVFTGLRVAGWEDRDVWARVQHGGQRRLPHALAPDAVAVASEELRQWWAASDTLLDQVPEPTRELVDRHAIEVEPVIKRWWSEYFTTELARVGPREAAAYYVVFHWNRAKLSSGRQALITEALADERAC